MRTVSLVDAPSGRPRTLADWRSIVLDAYAVQPTLSLTKRQGERLWGMDGPTCEHVLESLVDGGVLTRTVDERYCRSDYVGAVDPAGLP